MSNRSHGIKNTISNLKNRGEDLDKMSGLDFFARSGEWQTSYYAQYLQKIQAWEIEKQFESKLIEVLPKHAKIVIGDSYKLAANTHEKFDFIVLDNPLGCFGNNYCEHFEALDLALNLLIMPGIISLNIKTKPFCYEDKHEWKKRRNESYETDASSLSVDFILDFYTNFFSKRGYNTIYSFLEDRQQEPDLFILTSKRSRK